MTALDCDWTLVRDAVSPPCTGQSRQGFDVCVAIAWPSFIPEAHRLFIFPGPTETPIRGDVR